MRFALGAAKRMSLARKFVRYAFMNFLCVYTAAQSTQPKPVQNTTVHIVTEVRDLTGDPLRGMRPTDFSLSSAGTPLRFQMNRSKDGSPTCVLVVVSSYSGFDSLLNAANYLSNNVPSAVQSHFLISVLGPHGEYVGLQPVHDALDMLKSGTFSNENYEQAVSNLAKNKGSRAIIYMTNRLANPPDELKRAAKDAGALIYDVGGDEDENYAYSGTLKSAGPRSAAMWEGETEQSIRTVYVEPSIQKAFKQMAKVSLGRYRFTVEVPASVQAIQVRTKIWGDYQIEAYAYTDSIGPPPALILSTSKR